MAVDCQGGDIQMAVGREAEFGRPGDHEECAVRKRTRIGRRFVNQQGLIGASRTGMVSSYSRLAFVLRLRLSGGGRDFHGLSRGTSAAAHGAFEGRRIVGPGVIASREAFDG